MTEREEAQKLIIEAAELLSLSGDVLKIHDMAWHAANIFGTYEEDEFDVIYLDCAVCGKDHNCNIQVKRPKNISFQYLMSIEMVYRPGLGLWDRIKKAWDVLRNKTETNDFLLDENALTQMRDLFRRMDVMEKGIAKEAINELFRTT